MWYIVCTDIHTFGHLLGCAGRNLVDRLADMDVLQENVKEKQGRSVYKVIYQTDVHIHIYLQQGQDFALHGQVSLVV